MTKNEKYKILAQRRFESAANDLKSAEVILREGGYYGTTCFLSQQIAEKYLKGFIITKGKRPPRTHDLLQLLKICQKFDKNFSQLEKDLEMLNAYYIETRYAPEPIDYTKEQAKEALEAAQKVISTVVDVISKT